MAVADGPSGFGGWLILVLIGQTVAPVQVASALAEVVKTFTAAPLSPIGELVALAIVATTFGVFVMTIWVAVLMWQRKRLFPTAFLYQWIAFGLWGVVFFPGLGAAFGISLYRLVANANVAAGMAQMAGGLVVSGLWVWYVKASRRVANTFVR